MKRILIIIAICIAILSSAIAMIFVLTPKTIYATKINVLTNKIVLQVDEDYYLTNNNFIIEPANYTERPVFSSSDESIVKVDLFNGKITAKKIGSCNIIIFAKLNDLENTNSKILVEVIEKKLYPSQVDISIDSLELFVNQSVALNTNLVGKTNVLPTVTTSNNCVIYDFVTDTITAIKSGADKLFISYILSDNSTSTFEIDIIVKEKNKYVKDITIDLSNQNYVYLTYYTESSKSDCDVSITDGSDNVQIVAHEYKNICIKPLNKGTATIVVDSPTSICTFNIKIV